MRTEHQINLTKFD